MPIRTCPRCNQQIFYMDRIGDYIHTCNSSILALDEDDIPNFHTSFTNNEGVTTQQQGGMILQKGLVNKNLTPPEINEKKEDVEDYTVRGNRQSTNRQRQHYEWFEVK